MKKVGYIILTILMCMPLCMQALEIEGLNSENVIIYNLDEDKIIYEKNADEKTAIASLTKMMTTLVAIENIDNFDEEVKITQSMLNGISWDASLAGLKVGETYTYDELLYSSMIPSGADATQALAISTTGSISNFVAKMNEKAEELNLTNTHFVNTSGLDINGHYSTARDILELMKYALQNETFRKYFEATTSDYTLSNGLELHSTIVYKNKSLHYDLSYLKGGKTGYTDDAGLCLGALSNIDNTNIITVTINSPYEPNYLNLVDLNNIYKSLKKNYTKAKIVEEGEVVKTLETKYTKEPNTKITSTKDISRYVEKPYNTDDVKIEYTGEEIIDSSTKKGTKVGTLKIYYKDELLDEMPAIVTEELHFSLWNYLKENIIYYGILLIVIIITISLIRKPKKRKKA